MKKHHKFILGSFTTLVVVFMVTTAILLNGIIINQNLNYNQLSNKIDENKQDTQSKLNQLTESLMDTRSRVQALDNQIINIDQEFDLLKASASEDFSGIIEHAVKSVVTVRTDVGQGTGFIITEEGHIITNAHVLSGGSRVEVMNYEQEIIDTTFIGYNANFDIALLKIEGNYNKLNLENSNNVQVGEKVIAIGNPLGLQFSVSEGIVSGVHRLGINNLEAYIQTDAALNPGNSGGPLINKQGNVIGINNFKISGGESLGFALESNYIKQVVNSIAQDTLNQTLI
jgi:serine protease Do